MKTNVNTKNHGIVEICVEQAGIPSLRLLVHHAPNQRIEGRRKGSSFLVPLSELILDHDALACLNLDHPVRSASFVGEFDANGGQPVATPDHADSGVRPWPREHSRD